MLNQKHLIIVLGMHRSGTSAITRGLETLGVSLGNQLVTGKAGENDKGFFEDREFLDLNQTLLADLGTSWDALGNFPISTGSSLKIQKYQFSFSQLIKNRFQETDYYGLKDPRFCKLLPLIEPVLLDLGINVRLIIASRNPLSVANSILKRNQIPLVKGLYLWFEHTILSLQYSKNYPRLVVDYDRILKNTTNEIKRVADFLEINHQVLAEDLYSYQSIFLDSKLRHSEYTLADLVDNQTIPKIVVELYQILITLSEDPIFSTSADTISKINQLNNIYQDFLPVFKSHDYLEQINSDLQTISLKQTDSIIINNSNFKNEINSLNNENISLTATINSLNNEINSLSDQINLLTTENKNLNIEVQNLNQLYIQERQKVEARDTFIAQQYNQLEVSQLNLKSVLQSRSWKITKPLRVIKENYRKSKIDK